GGETAYRGGRLAQIFARTHRAYSLQGSGERSLRHRDRPVSPLWDDSDRQGRARPQTLDHGAARWWLRPQFLSLRGLWPQAGRRAQTLQRLHGTLSDAARRAFEPRCHRLERSTGGLAHLQQWFLVRAAERETTWPMLRPALLEHSGRPQLPSHVGAP